MTATEGKSTRGGAAPLLNENFGLVISLGIVAITLVTIDLTQYSRYGYELLLGWDSPTYAWWASQVQANGPVAMILAWHYPWFYVQVLASLGTILGNVLLAERILPLILFLPLAFSFYQITSRISSNRELGYLACILSALTIDTIAVYSDLNRELLAYGLSLTVGVMISQRMTKGPLNWTHDRQLILARWTPLMAVVAYTQTETYGVLVLSVLPLFILSRRLKTVLIGLSSTIVPVIAIFPLMLPLYQGYLTTVGGYLQYPTGQVLYDVWLFLGGYSFPLTVLGFMFLSQVARAGNQVARFLLFWLVTLVVLAPLAEEIGVGVERVVLLVPVPILGVLGLAAIIRGIHSLGKYDWFKLGTTHRNLGIRLRQCTVSAALISLLLVPTVLTTFPNVDNWLSPYANPHDVGRLQLAAQIAKGKGYTNPILVLYGSDVIQLWSAYFGVENPNTLPYYGKLQYLFTLPDPSRVYSFLYDPAYEMKYSTDYTESIRSGISSLSDLTSRAIVLVNGNTYNRPISEVFLNSTFEVAPGIFIMPPHSLNARQIDDWRLFGYDDRTQLVGGYGYRSNWSEAPLVLESVIEPPNAVFKANYTISLLHSWKSMNLTLHYRDWGPSFTYRDNSTAQLAPLEVFLDNRLILSHAYTGTGVATIQYGLGSMSAGLHQISVESGAANEGVVVTLDYLEIRPA